MKPRIPKRYRRSVSERRFVGKLLPAAENPREKTFLREAYRRDTRGRYHLRRELSSEELRRLAAIIERIRTPGLFRRL